LLQNSPEIDESKVERWALLGGTDREIAHHLGVSERQLRERCRKLLRRLRATRRLTLRTLQWKEAQAGSVQMLLMLGKEELRQGQKKVAREDRLVVRRRQVTRNPIANG
jgi:DNA-binding NarL/FixJ family response regulator